MLPDTTNSGKNLWLRWVLANVAGLTVGLGLFGFLADAAAGEHGTLSSDVGHMAGLTTAGAVIGLAQWLVIRRQAKDSGRAKWFTILAPTLTFITVIVVSTTMFGLIAGPVVSTSPSDPSEITAFMIRFFTILAIGLLTALLVSRLALGRPVDKMAWGLLAASLIFPIGFLIGIAAIGPPVDFFMAILLSVLASGIYQWQMLREQEHFSRWWVVANPLGLGLGAAISLLLAFGFAEVVFPVSFLDTSLGFIVIMGTMGFISGMVGGAISGVGLVRLLGASASGDEISATIA